MATTITGHISPLLAWRVFVDNSLVDNTLSQERLRIAYGLLSVNNTVISTNDIDDGGTLHVSRKDALTFPTPFKDVFVDLQSNKYLYAKVTLSTNDVELEYSSSPPAGTGAIDIITSEFQRIPLAFITAEKYVVDLRPLGGGGGSSSSIEPFTIILTIENDADGNPTSATYTLWPGVVNETMPSNMLTTFTYSLNSTAFIKLTVTTDGRAVTGITIASAASYSAVIGASSGSAPTTFDILIGVITGNTLYQSRTGNITATLTEAVREGKAVPVPGTSPYNIYYTWIVNS